MKHYNYGGIGVIGTILSMSSYSNLPINDVLLLCWGTGDLSNSSNNTGSRSLLVIS